MSNCYIDRPEGGGEVAEMISLSIIGFCLTGSSCYYVTRFYFGFPIKTAFLKLVLISMIWDMIFTLKITLDFYIYNDIVLKVLFFIGLIAVNCSLSSTLVLSGMNLMTSKEHIFWYTQNFMKWLNILTAITFAHAMITVSIEWKGLLHLYWENFSLTNVWTIILVFLIVSVNIKTIIRVIKHIDFEEINKTPIYLSLVMIIFWGQSMVYIYLTNNTDCQINFTVYMIEGFLNQNLGFFYFLASYSRIKNMKLNIEKESFKLSANPVPRSISNELSHRTDSNDIKKNLLVYASF